MKKPEIDYHTFKGYDKPYDATFAAPLSLVQIFFLFFTDKLLTGIVTETNRYARLCLKEKYDSWEIITLEDIKAYFVFMIIMGIVKLPALADYWRKNEFFNYRPIASRITRTRSWMYVDLFTSLTMTHCLPMEKRSTIKFRRSKTFLTIYAKSAMSISFQGRILQLMKL